LDGSSRCCCWSGSSALLLADRAYHRRGDHRLPPCLASLDARRKRHRRRGNRSDNRYSSGRDRLRARSTPHQVARPANLFVCRLTACNGSRVRSDLTNGPISQRPLANLGNRGIEAANYTLARTNRLLIFGLTSRPYYGNPDGADAVVGCPRVGADFSGGRCPPSGLCGEPRAALDPCRKQEERERV
jgi:hypothetical protein